VFSPTPSTGRHLLMAVKTFMAVTGTLLTALNMLALSALIKPRGI
jgi:hypothetical protein